MLATRKRLICLANSWRSGGRCVAGIELIENQSTGWIRPISARPTHEVATKEYEYENGTQPRLLDVISVPLLRPTPSGSQTENWILDPDRRWSKEGEVAWSDLKALAQSPDRLWIPEFNSSKGTNDLVPEEPSKRLSNSLYLIHVPELTVDVHDVFTEYGFKRRVRGCFQYCRLTYSLSITDPEFNQEYCSREVGVYKIGEAFLTVSLAEPLNGSCSKLIAAVIEEPRD